MPKFTLIGEHTDLSGNPDGTKITYEFVVDTIDNVLEHVDLFIRGCGYNPTGTLDYVADDYYYGLDPDFGDHGGGSTLNDYPDLNVGAGSNFQSGGAGNVWAQAYYQHDIKLKETE